MKKRILAILLVAAMLCTMLVGCSSDGNDNSTPDSSTPVETTVGEDGRTKEGIMYVEGLPIVDEGDYTFSLFCDDSADNDNEFAMMPILEGQTNVVVDLQYFPYENAKERLNLDLNSGDYADVIAGWLLSDQMVLQYSADGTFIPLEDIYEKYCPRITEILNLPGVREEMTFPDGHIYTIPYVCGDTTVGYSPYINTDWLKNVNMDMPTTTEEFEAVLQAFKDQDANGNGDATDEIPFSTDPNNKHLEAMTGYFGVPMDKYGFTVDDSTGESVWAGTSEAYRELLKWLNGLYNKGLLDSEIFTQDSSMWEGKGNQDMYGCSIAYGSNEFSGLPTDVKGPFDPLPVLNADNGGKWLRDTTGFSVYRTQAVITDNAEHPEIIARWFDNAFSEENGVGCNNGPVGIRYIKEGDMYRKVPDSEFTEEENEYYSWGNLWPQAVPKYLPRRFNEERVINDNPDYDEKGVLQEYYEQWLTKCAPAKFWVPDDMTEVYSEYATSINDYFNESQAAFVTGIRDINSDDEWQAYADQLEKLHLEDYMTARGVTKSLD